MFHFDQTLCWFCMYYCKPKIFILKYIFQLQQNYHISFQYGITSLKISLSQKSAFVTFIVQICHCRTQFSISFLSVAHQHVTHVLKVQIFMNHIKSPSIIHPNLIVSHSWLTNTCGNCLKFLLTAVLRPIPHLLTGPDPEGVQVLSEPH